MQKIPRFGENQEGADEVDGFAASPFRGTSVGIGPWLPEIVQRYQAVAQCVKSEALRRFETRFVHYVMTVW